MAHQAQEIATALRDPNLSYRGDDPSTAKVVALARANVGHCLSAGNGAEEVDTLIQLAGETIPYLDAAQLQGVWSKPNWVGCTTQTEPVRAMLAMLDSLAQRDFASVSSHGVALLQTHKKILSPMARDWLLRATMLAAIAQGNYAQVSQIDASAGADVPLVAATELQREYLLAFADAELHAATISAKASDPQTTKAN